MTGLSRLIRVVRPRPGAAIPPCTGNESRIETTGADGSHGSHGPREEPTILSSRGAHDCGHRGPLTIATSGRPGHGVRGRLVTWGTRRPLVAAPVVLPRSVRRTPNRGVRPTVRIRPSTGNNERASETGRKFSRGASHPGSEMSATYPWGFRGETAVAKGRAGPGLKSRENVGGLGYFRGPPSPDCERLPPRRVCRRILHRRIPGTRLVCGREETWVPPWSPRLSS